MLTDSRSFLSYARHDYFRRILCSFIGTLVDDNEFENDPELLKEIVEGICYKNIKNYLKLED
jgi:glucuronate isomerase